MDIEYETPEEFARKTAAAEALIAQDQSKFEFERVRKMPYQTPPTSLRLSAPLHEALERIATHRKRAGLIRHILWEYVQAHAPVFAREMTAREKHD